MKFDCFSLADLTHWVYLTLWDTLTIYSGWEPKIRPKIHKVRVLARIDHTSHFLLWVFEKATGSWAQVLCKERKTNFTIHGVPGNKTVVDWTTIWLLNEARKIMQVIIVKDQRMIIKTLIKMHVCLGIMTMWCHVLWQIMIWFTSNRYLEIYFNCSP